MCLPETTNKNTNSTYGIGRNVYLKYVNDIYM